MKQVMFLGSSAPDTPLKAMLKLCCGCSILHVEYYEDRSSRNPRLPDVFPSSSSFEQTPEGKRTPLSSTYRKIIKLIKESVPQIESRFVAVRRK